MAMLVITRWYIKGESRPKHRPGNYLSFFFSQDITGLHEIIFTQLVWLWICFVTKWSLRGEAPGVLKCKVLKVALLLLTMLQWNCQNKKRVTSFQWPWPVGTPADGALGLHWWTEDDFVTSKSRQRRIPVLSGMLERRTVWQIPLESPCGAWIVVLCCVLGVCVCAAMFIGEKQHHHPQQTRKLPSISKYTPVVSCTQYYPLAMTNIAMEEHHF